MGKKSILAVIISLVGGFFIGFSVGFQYAIELALIEIKNISKDLILSLNPQLTVLAETLSIGLISGFRTYVAEEIFSPAPFIFIGIIIFIIALGLAYKTGETTWIPFRKKKEEND